MFSKFSTASILPELLGCKQDQRRTKKTIDSTGIKDITWPHEKTTVDQKWVSEPTPDPWFKRATGNIR
jgi:hypothetical protein